MSLICFYDFLSHSDMHLPFNEGYVRVLRAAFPYDEILVAAGAGHLDNLKDLLSGLDGVRYQCIEPFEYARSPKAQVPWHGWPAALSCFHEIERTIGSEKPEFLAIGGMDANMLSVIPKRIASKRAIPVHYILHNHLEAAQRWRTRNPLIRMFDYISAFSRPLPERQSILALELSIGDTIEREFVSHRHRIKTLEHPVLETEWFKPAVPNRGRPLRIAFSGHCGLGKGFDKFVELAAKHSGTRFEFHAIGRANPNARHLDLTPLASKPTDGGLSRQEFLSALRRMDMVCIPLAEDTRYVASGSVIDAFAAGKPLLVPCNPMMQAIEAKYGQFGPLTNTPGDISDLFDRFDIESFLGMYPKWIESIIRIRNGRSSESLANVYRESIFR